MTYKVYIYIYIYIYIALIGYYVQLCSSITKRYPSKEMNCGRAEVAVTISNIHIYMSIFKRCQTFNGNQ